MQNWVQNNRQAFERDVLQDFCQAALKLGEQSERFAATNTVSFAVLRSLVGEAINKGLLWRLKDKAYQIFFKSGGGSPVELLLDWTIGYIFHESFKLMEDAHQGQYYAPRFNEFARQEHLPAVATLVRDMSQIQADTCESMRREVTRIDSLLRHAQKLFCLFFCGCAKHRPLARFINDNNKLVRDCFQGNYNNLINAIYSNEPERMYTEAAWSLLASARGDAAARAAKAALALNPTSDEALLLLETVKKDVTSISTRQSPLKE